MSYDVADAGAARERERVFTTRELLHSFQLQQLPLDTPDFIFEFVRLGYESHFRIGSTPYSNQS
jgi:hypothetical protein